MTTTAPAKPAAQPAQSDVEQALQKIATDWDGHLFFRRLEQRGVVPADDNEAADLLKLSMALEAQEAQKQASARSEVSGLVQRSLQRLGVNPADQRAEIDALSKQAAAQVLSNDPAMLQAFTTAALYLNGAR